MSSRKNDSQRLPPNYLVVSSQKPMHAYILSGVTQLMVSDKLIVLGRGKDINMAVNVALGITSRLEDEVEISKVEVGSDKTSSGRYVSRIQIEIKRLKKGHEKT